jgi:hypothetical protein
VVFVVPSIPIFIEGNWSIFPILTIPNSRGSTVIIDNLADTCHRNHMRT